MADLIAHAFSFLPVPVQRDPLKRHYVYAGAHGWGVIDIMHLHIYGRAA